MSCDSRVWPIRLPHRQQLWNDLGRRLCPFSQMPTVNSPHKSFIFLPQRGHRATAHGLRRDSSTERRAAGDLSSSSIGMSSLCSQTPERSNSVSVAMFSSLAWALASSTWTNDKSSPSSSNVMLVGRDGACGPPCKLVCIVLDCS